MIGDFDVYVMGRNLNGQIGYGGLSNCTDPRRIHFDQLKSINKRTKSIQISCGANFCCYLAKSRDKYELISYHFRRVKNILAHVLRHDRYVFQDIIIHCQHFTSSHVVL
jgi:hypothetical protein